MWYRILPQVLNMSLTASIAILFVLLARQVLRRAPRSFSYALWGIVLFRLLCPVALTSEYSLMQLMQRVTVPASSHTSSAEYLSKIDDRVLAQQLGIEYILESDVQSPDLSSDMSAGNAADVPADPSQEIALTTDPYPLARPITIATFLWLVGILSLLYYSIRSLRRLRRQLVTAVPLASWGSLSHCQNQKANIYLADHIATPFVLGVLSPRIYLPSSLTESQQTYILFHEQYHIRRLDHVVKLLSYIALCLHWFNPLVWLAFFLSGKDMEMSCDEAVLRQLGDDIRADYSSSLLSLATGHRILAGAPLAFGEGDTKDRIHHVLQWKKPRVWLVGASLILCAVLAFSLMTNPRQDPSFDGSTYRVEQILYDAPQYSFTYTTETAPQFTITSDYVLMSRSRSDDTDAWHELGSLKQVAYSREELYSLYDPLYCTAHEKLDQVTLVYRVDPINVSSPVFFLVMQTYRGDVMLAQGYGRDQDSHVRWLFLLEKQSGSYDLSAMMRALQQQYGNNTDYFSLYDCGTEPGVILLGFQCGADSPHGAGAVGYAYFRYDTNLDDYVLLDSDVMPDSVTGLHTIELSQDDGYDTNLQILLSTRDDLAAVRVFSNLAATRGFQSKKEVPTPGHPNMLVFPCPDPVTLKNLQIEYIYTWNSEWNDHAAALPYGSYRMIPKEGEEFYPFIGLHLQEDNTFTFTYDPLSSYLNYGHYTIEDNTLIAVTDDGRFQFCFEILDNQTLAFLGDLSSDVSPIDERIVEPVTDGALFSR